jgi:hypothetical protein
MNLKRTTIHKNSDKETVTVLRERIHDIYYTKLVPIFESNDVNTITIRHDNFTSVYERVRPTSAEEKLKILHDAIRDTPRGQVPLSIIEAYLKIREDQ